MDEAGDLILKQVRATLWQFGVNTGIRLETEEGRLLSSCYRCRSRWSRRQERWPTGARRGQSEQFGGEKHNIWGPATGGIGAGFWAWRQSRPMCGFGEAVLEDVNSIPVDSVSLPVFGAGWGDGACGAAVERGGIAVMGTPGWRVPDVCAELAARQRARLQCLGQFEWELRGGHGG